MTPDSLPPVIDDFEEREPFHPWFVYNDGTNGKVQRETTDTEAGHRAMHVSAQGFGRWGSGFVLRFGPITPARRACAIDASRYAGIRFRARGHGSLRMSLATATLVSTAEGGHCKAGWDCYDLPGADVKLTNDWKDFAMRFCQLVPEGWGQKFNAVDPRELYALHFRLPKDQPHDVWIDDIEFIPHSNELDAQRCGPPCPLDALPKGAVIAPNRLAPALTAAGLELHTFEEATRSCAPLTRRYVSYIPRRLARNSPAPVLVALHGAGASAEAFRDHQTRGRFEALSERDGFILVYANAAPGAATVNPVPNSGTWYPEPTPLDEVDDFAYLKAIRDDLLTRHVIDGTNPLFLVGHSIGAGMAIEAVRRNPNVYSGFAAVMPYLGIAPEPPTAATATHLARVLFAYSQADPGLPNGYARTLDALASDWAAALGITKSAFATAVHKPLPDRVNEGAEYTGTFPNALATRDSRAEQIDLISSAQPNVAMRVLEFDHAGHFWPTPHPSQYDVTLFAETWGLRNQDIDIADVIWDYFHEVRR